jgi:hypothetical protein
MTCNRGSALAMKLSSRSTIHDRVETTLEPKTHKSFFELKLESGDEFDLGAIIVD